MDWILEPMDSNDNKCFVLGFFWLWNLWPINVIWSPRFVFSYFDVLMNYYEFIIYVNELKLYMNLNMIMMTMKLTPFLLQHHRKLTPKKMKTQNIKFVMSNFRILTFDPWELFLLVWLYYLLIVFTNIVMFMFSYEMFWNHFSHLWISNFIHIDLTFPSPL